MSLTKTKISKKKQTIINKRYGNHAIKKASLRKIYWPYLPLVIFVSLSGIFLGQLKEFSFLLNAPSTSTSTISILNINLGWYIFGFIILIIILLIVILSKLIKKNK